ncbi:MAG: hypothetical protein Q4C88_07350 [Akkermansia sp.]|nr:hypothetical protein [Akkermansia sp.]
MRSNIADENQEARLVAVLASMKVQITPEADFEERFLYHFHERVTQEIVCTPAHRRALDHILQAFQNFGMRKIAYGSSALGVGALALGFFSVQDSQENGLASNHRQNRFETSLASLAPSLRSDMDSCTCVRVFSAGRVNAEEDAFMAQGGPDESNGYTSSMNKGWTADFEAPANTSAQRVFAY